MRRQLREFLLQLVLSSVTSRRAACCGPATTVWCINRRLCLVTSDVTTVTARVVTAWLALHTAIVRAGPPFPPAPKTVRDVPLARSVPPAVTGAWCGIAVATEVPCWDTAWCVWVEHYLLALTGASTSTGTCPRGALGRHTTRRGRPEGSAGGPRAHSLRTTHQPDLPNGGCLLAAVGLDACQRSTARGVQLGTTAALCAAAAWVAWVPATSPRVQHAGVWDMRGWQPSRSR